MARPTKATRERNRLERLKQKRIIIQSKLTLLQQALDTVDADIRLLES